MLLIFVLIFLYIIILLIMAVKNTMRIWCSWCSIADFSSACTGSSPVIRCLSVYSQLDILMFGRIAIGLLLMIIGFTIIFFSAKIAEFMWRISRMDEYLWWTRTGVLLGWFLLSVIGGMLMMWFIWFSNPANSITTMS